MTTLELVLLMLLVVDAIALAALVLLQQGRGADVGAAFGSGSANTMFGSTGASSFLTRLTVWLAIGFFLISFGLAWTAKERAENLGVVGIPLLESPEEIPAPEVPLPAGDVPAAGSEVPDGETPAPETGGSTAERLTQEPEGVDSDIPDV